MSHTALMYNNGYKLCSMILVAVLLGVFPGRSIAVVLQTAAQESYPKYYQTENSGMAGVCYDMIEAVQKHDPDIRFKGHDAFLPFVRIQKYLASGEMDVFFGLKKTESRIKKYIFSDLPLYSVSYVLVKRSKDDVEIQSFDDVRRLGDGGRIITVLGSAAADFFTQDRGPGCL